MNKSELSKKKYLVLDIGTSNIKCGCVDSKYDILAQHHRKFPMMQRQSTFEIDFDLFINTTSDLLMECLADQVVKHSTVEALLITSQAQTFAPVDADFNPIRKGIVWLDERAEKEAAYLKEQLPDFTKAAGFSNPIAGLYISKLLWLKQNEPIIFRRAKAFPLINEYLVYKLTGKFYSDVTSFGMSGMYDFRQNSINPDLLTLLGLTEDFFPELKNAGMRGELISQQIQRVWKLDNRFPVFLCGNDQGASACGAGLKQPGDVNINFGTAMVFYTITDSLITDLTDDQIAGKHPVGNDFFLLNFERDFGMQIRQLKNKYFQHGTYDQLFKTYLHYPDINVELPVSGDIDHPDYLSIEEVQKFCAGIIKHYMFRLKSHFAQIQQAVAVNNIFLSGGMLKSEVWFKILQDTLNRPLIIENRTDAGLYGAIDIYLHSENWRSMND